MPRDRLNTSGTSISGRQHDGDPDRRAVGLSRGAPGGAIAGTVPTVSTGSASSPLSIAAGRMPSSAPRQSPRERWRSNRARQCCSSASRRRRCRRQWPIATQAYETSSALREHAIASRARLDFAEALLAPAQAGGRTTWSVRRRGGDTAAKPLRCWPSWRPHSPSRRCRAAYDRLLRRIRRAISHQPAVTRATARIVRASRHGADAADVCSAIHG